jgi:hypothetical protein
MRIDEGFNSKAQAVSKRAQPDFNPVKRLSSYERLATPIEFRDLLIDLIGGTK